MYKATNQTPCNTSSYAIARIVINTKNDTKLPREVDDPIPIFHLMPNYKDMYIFNYWCHYGILGWMLAKAKMAISETWKK